MKSEPVLAGTYIIGVSGGVDSAVLLDVLCKRKDLSLIVAHVDHGIRNDSDKDAEFVRQLANKYGLTYELESLSLGAQASEETARIARYKFLHECREKYNADAIITAHHQDDVLETIVINIIRGTGWRGLVSLRSHPILIRPLIRTPKVEIVRYAHDNSLEWREDSTNSDTRYLRNYIRRNIMPKVAEDPTARRRLTGLWESQAVTEKEIFKETANLLQKHGRYGESGYELPRHVLIMAGNAASLELLQAAVKTVGGQRLQRVQAKNLLLFVKTARPQKVQIPTKGIECHVTPSTLIVAPSSI